MRILAVQMDDDEPQQAALEEAMRVAEALVFASAAPVTAVDLAARLPQGVPAEIVLDRLAAAYAGRGVNLVQIAGGYTFRTAPDLAYLLARDAEPPRKLSRAALEVLAIIAYHQPVTRAEIEDIRGVSTSKGSLDALLETGWIRMRGRRRTPGRPVTYGTTPAFLQQFGLDRIDDLPGIDDLKGAGFLDRKLPPGFKVPLPSDETTLRDDEDPLDDLFDLDPLAGEGDDNAA